MLLQAYDFQQLYERYGCTMQAGEATSGVISRQGSNSFGAGWGCELMGWFTHS